MSLRYLVKLEMLIAHVLPLSCWRKKLRNLFTCAASIFARFEIRLITVCGEYCNRRCTEHALLIRMNWNRDRLRTEWAKVDHVVIAAAIRQCRP